MIAESADLPEVERDDIEVVKVPAVDIAIKLWPVQAANFVLLGTYLNRTKAIPLELVEAELKERFGDKREILELIRKLSTKG